MTFDEPLDLNTASVEDLRGLPGIGEKLATRIVMFREDHGPFEHLDDLLRVRGLTPKALERIASSVVVEEVPTRPRPDGVPASRRMAIVDGGSSVERTAPIVVPVLVEEPERTLPSRAAPQLYAVPDSYDRASRDGVAGYSPTPLEASLVLVRPTIRCPADAPPVSSGKRRLPHAVAASFEPEVPEVPWPELARTPAAPPPKRLPWRTGAIALCFATAAAFAVYAVAPLRYATGDVATKVDKLASEVDAVKLDQRKANERVDLLAEVSAQLPGTIERVDALHANREAQEREAAAAQATTLKLTREVASLREALRKSQRDADRRIYEMRLQLETRPRASQE